MYNIVFICYGNICRSPMAEMIFKDIINRNNKRYLMSCVSRSTSMEELGNDIYPQAKEVLIKNNIPIERHQATQFKKSDYEKYDLIIVMEERNKYDLLDIIKEDKDNKIHLLMEYTDTKIDIEDPWYTNRFDYVFDLINKGCLCVYNYLIEKGYKSDNKI